jgi:hypothetical protein
MWLLQIYLECFCITFKWVNARALLLMNFYGDMSFLNMRLQVNSHLAPRPILLTRHGESLHNVRGRVGGDTVLRFASMNFNLRPSDDTFIYLSYHFELWK